MKFHLQREGRGLGAFSLEELRAQREAGELTGTEHAWRQGMNNWVQLDSLLAQDAAGTLPAAAPPSAANAGNGPNRAVQWGIFGAVTVVAGVLAVAGYFMVREVKRAMPVVREELSPTPGQTPIQPDRPGAMRIASQPVVWTAKTKTAADESKQGMEFRRRQWVEGYAKRGRRDAACYPGALKFLESWTLRQYGGDVADDLPSNADWADQLAARPDCDDPLVLTACAANTVDPHAAIARLERAVQGFKNSKHLGYVKFYANLQLARRLAGQHNRTAQLEAAARPMLIQLLSDGSAGPEDQDQMAEILLDGWGSSFYQRNLEAVVQIVKNAGKPFEWLALMLEGKNEVTKAWQARGGGYANAVTEKGWEGFAAHLALARSALTKACEIRPDLPKSSTLMMYVSLGDSDLEEMRLWFDRAVTAQIDYDPAWTQLRWGLRPRWYGDLNSMLAFGVTAVKTGRFDTDVPRKLMDVIADLASEADTPPGEHLYGRDEIWPHVREMYDGYIAAQSNADTRDGWRSAYATVSFLAGKFDVSRTQLEALQWNPHPQNLTGWGVDLSLMPLEVAARTGPSAQMVVDAEAAYRRQDLAKASELYNQAASDPRSGERSKEFARARMASIQLEQQLQKSGWVSFLPQSDHDPNWAFLWGAPHRLADGALEVHSGKTGHFLFSRAPVGRNFEVKGEFELVRSSTRDFQAGLIMGMPDCDAQLGSSEWYSFTMRRNVLDGPAASFSAGWTRSNLYKPASLREGANSFDFRFQDGAVTASVNGQTIFNGVHPPRNIRVAEGGFDLGLGAFNDGNETVVRYRGLQVRKLQ